MIDGARMKRFMTTAVSVAIGGAGAYGLIKAVSALTPLWIVDGARAVKMDYVDFVSIILTGVSLILAALGFVVAILAFIGWSSIGEHVSQLATSFLKEAIKDGGELHKLVKDEAKSIIYRGIEPVDTEFEDSGAGEGKA